MSKDGLKSSALVAMWRGHPQTQLPLWFSVWEGRLTLVLKTRKNRKERKVMVRSCWVYDPTSLRLNCRGQLTSTEKSKSTKSRVQCWAPSPFIYFTILEGPTESQLEREWARSKQHPCCHAKPGPPHLAGESNLRLYASGQPLLSHCSSPLLVPLWQGRKPPSVEKKQKCSGMKCNDFKKQSNSFFLLREIPLFKLSWSLREAKAHSIKKMLADHLLWAPLCMGTLWQTCTLHWGRRARSQGPPHFLKPVYVHTAEILGTVRSNVMHLKIFNKTLLILNKKN